MAASKRNGAPKKGAVLLIGAGRMGGALLKGWLAAKSFSVIHVIEPKPSPALKKLAKSRAVALHSSFDAKKLPKFSASVIAIKPQVLKGEGAFLAALGAQGGLALSIAAGVTISFLQDHLGKGARIVRAMPNTPGAIGKGITALFAAAPTKADRALAERLTAPLGATIWLARESQMDAVTAVSGSGPAYVFLLAEALAAAGEAAGLDAAMAAKLARATVSGAGALLDADPREPGDLRQEVTSPGGTTEAALSVLMAEDGQVPLMRRAVKAAAARSKELGK